MSCHETEGLIALYVEGDLEGNKLNRVLLHLSECESCQKFAQELRANQRVLKSLRDEPCDEGIFQVLPDRVTERITSAKRATPIAAGTAFMYRWRWQALGTACMLVLVAVLLISPHRKQQGLDHQNLGKGDDSAKRLQVSPDSAEPSKLGPASTPDESQAAKTRKSRYRSTNIAKLEHHRATLAREGRLSPKTVETKGQIQTTALSRGAKEENTRVPNLFLEPRILTNPPTPPAWPSSVQTTDVDLPEPADQMVIKLLTDDPNIIIVWLVDQKRGEENAQN